MDTIKEKRHITPEVASTVILKKDLHKFVTKNAKKKKQTFAKYVEEILKREKENWEFMHGKK